MPAVHIDRKQNTVRIAARPNIEPDSQQWFSWLDRPYNQEFYVTEDGIYDEVEIFTAHKRKDGVWWAHDDDSTDKIVLRLGKSPDVTKQKIISVSNEIQAQNAKKALPKIEKILNSNIGRNNQQIFQKLKEEAEEAISRTKSEQ